MKTRVLLVSVFFLGVTSFLLSQVGLLVPTRVYLEGAFLHSNIPSTTAGLPIMQNKLRANPYNAKNYIPVKDPYYYPMPFFDITASYMHVEPIFNFSMHNIIDSATVFSVTGDNAIVDWVFLELRSQSDSTLVLATRSALVQRDGDVVDLDGVNHVFFPNITLSKFYLVVRHRNHLGAMSKLVSANQMVDFTNPQTPIYDFGPNYIQGINYTGMSVNTYSVPNFNCLWMGDADANGIIKFDSPEDDLVYLYGDVLFYPSNPNQSSSFDKALGYLNSDFDMDGKAKFDNPYDDKNLLFASVLFYPLNEYTSSNFSLFIQQIPK